MSLYDECPICLKLYIYGLWEHIIECARAAQRKLDGREAKRDGRYSL